ncbi:MAG: UbiD family decarboxylase [Gemmatimonadales bacterium]|nr:UbiD family decarboxylase [Gemmatimonadales bacterium]
MTDAARAPYPDLQSFLAALERRGELLRVTAEVDPKFEIAELVQRVIRQDGPALLFERVKGADFPVVLNMFGSTQRIELALGRHPQAIGQELLELVQRLNPPTLRTLWNARANLLRARFMKPDVVSRAVAQEVVEAPRLDRLPNLWSWPRDGGPFITWGPTLTQDPRNGRRNFGLYRLQVFDERTTGMHWQSMKGGRGHHFEAERRNVPLETAVVLGGDPVTMLSSIFPLPEDFDELGFAGYVRGWATPMVAGKSVRMLVPANAEFVLEGVVPPHERRMEGPFGDHYGHYSEADPFPVFHVTTVTRRRNAVCPAAVVGKPPQEDKWVGNAAGEIIGPLIKVVNPNIRDLFAWDDAVFHNLLAVSLTERHPKEVLKVALNLMGTGQLALTKVALMVRDDVSVHDFPALLRELWYRFEPEERMLLIPIAPLDTLDYTSYRLHVGSKLILDATGEPVTTEPPPRDIHDPRRLDPRVLRYKVLDGGFVVVVVKENPREVLKGLVQWDGLGPVRFVTAVSDDVDLADQTSTIWGIFTRFDPARDMIFQRQAFVGARPLYSGRIGIDATWKEGYPPPVTVPEETIRLVDRRWGEYFPAGYEKRVRGSW